MERAKTENRSAFAQAIKRREGAMREMLGMGSDPVRQVDADRRDMPLAVIWRIPGRGDRSRAGWSDTVGAQRRRRVPWLFLLSSFARRNGLSSLGLRSRKNPAKAGGEPPETMES